MSDAIIGLVMDRSGSMGWPTYRSSTIPWEQAVQGFDQFVEEQAAAEGDAWLSLVAFDNEIDTPYEAWNCRDIPSFTEGEATKGISPRGGTRLYDATTAAIKAVDDWLADNEWFDGVKTVVVITDGEENASVDTTWDELKALIAKKSDEGWEFQFLGAELSAVQNAANLGFQSQQYDPTNTRIAYAGASSYLTQSRQSHK